MALAQNLGVKNKTKTEQKSILNTISEKVYVLNADEYGVDSIRIKVKLFLFRPWRPLGLREVEAPTFSDIRVTDGGKVVSTTRRPHFTPRKIPGTHFR
jgi:hypothetical protein